MSPSASAADISEWMTVSPTSRRPLRRNGDRWCRCPSTMRRPTGPMTLSVLSRRGRRPARSMGSMSTTCGAFKGLRLARGLRQNSQATEWVGNVVAEVLDIDIGTADGKRKVSRLIKIWIENDALRVVQVVDKKGERPAIEVRN